VIVIFFVIILTVVLYKAPTYRGVCAFDLDDTLTCGIENARDAIKVCKQNNYKIAIVTARGKKYYSDIRLYDLGLSEKDFIDDFYHRDARCSYLNDTCSAENIALQKTDQLIYLSKKYNVEPKRVIFFDDQLPNIEKARNAGFSVVHANDTKCGIPNVDLESLMA
jgi:phosphoglycolate phosphatase-like HAD superfamily hydrolase